MPLPCSFLHVRTRPCFFSTDNLSCIISQSLKPPPDIAESVLASLYQEVPDVKTIKKEKMPDACAPRRKPDSDSREYRLIMLPNKLDVVLVSDPQTETAAAAVSVSAGQLQDPTEVQGLAHFCEHMLFLGSEKFPSESDFDSFCAQSAGYSNAWTGMDRTVYHFMLAHNKLHDALNRFSGFFTAPLFTESLTERELHAVDSENNKNLQEDTRREYQLWRSTAKAGSAVQRFGTGNWQVSLNLKPTH
jgi:secreted Zn-dependent insulinase-like peptidase